MLPDIIRAPNHLGDFVMALPALAAAPAADVVVARWLAPLAEQLRRTGAVIPLDRGRGGILRAVSALRRRRYGSGVLLPPSFSSALIFRLGGVRRIRGAATDRRSLLLSDPLPRSWLQDRHRSIVYAELVAGRSLDAVPAPRLPRSAATDAEWARLRGDAGTGPVVGVFPGSNAASRRWDADRFAAVADRLARDGARVHVFGAPAEAEVTRSVAGTRAIDFGGRTSLPVLASALAECDILLTNDSGPMHLAAAVGTRTLVVSGPADTQETAPGGTGHVYLQRLDLPCVPCVKNECPRRGAGYILPEAERECLRLIEPRDVLEAARRMLS